MQTDKDMRAQSLRNGAVGMRQKYSLVIVGSGFASSFFLIQYLKYAPANDRVLVLERGFRQDPLSRLRNRRNSDISFEALIDNRTPNKTWVQNLAFGGGMCWTGNTPRMHPSDFKTHSLYGIGSDWPLTYEDLEPYYAFVEDQMGIAGANAGPYPRSKPYPFPPHRFNAFDKLLAKKYPGLHIPFPSARSSSPESGRAVCCNNGVCKVCPISAKFQIDLHMAAIYEDPRVTLIEGAAAQSVDTQAEQVVGVTYILNGSEHYVATDMAVIGAHAIMTPYILLQSGITHPTLGRYLNEQVACDVLLNLNGVENFDGGQLISGLGLMFLDGPFRSVRPGCLVESWNSPWLRAERGRWRQRAALKFVFEDIPSIDNYVGISDRDAKKPKVYYSGFSPYVKAGIDSVRSLVEELIRDLPVESYDIKQLPNFGSVQHIQGTTRMGMSSSDSLIDKDLRHHSIRNLVVLGSGVFPTCPAANPTLTLSALAVRSADRLMRSAG